jgi:4-carboxymuconolactone decarboxylase
MTPHDGESAYNDEPPRLARLTPAMLTERQRQLYESVTGGKRGGGPFALVDDDGSLHGPFNAMLVAPHVGARLEQLGAVLRYESVLPDIVRETVILYVASQWRSEFEWYAHSAVAAAVGMLSTTVESLKEGQRPVGEDQAVLIAYDVCLSLDRAGAVPRDLYDAARAEFSDVGIVELASIYGYYTALAALLAVFDVELPSGTARTWRHP